MTAHTDPEDHTMTTPAARIEIARKAAAVRLAILADTIREACPAGNSHAYVQHRDRKPAWCEACGYAEDGTLIRADAGGRECQAEETP